MKEKDKKYKDIKDDKELLDLIDRVETDLPARLERMEEEIAGLCRIQNEKVDIAIDTSAPGNPDVSDSLHNFDPDRVAALEERINRIKLYTSGIPALKGTLFHMVKANIVQLPENVENIKRCEEEPLPEELSQSIQSKISKYRPVVRSVPMVAERLKSIEKMADKEFEYANELKARMAELDYLTDVVKQLEQLLQKLK